MRASVSTLLTEAHQEVDLAVLLMPEAAFLALGCLVLPATLISSVRAIRVLGLVWCASDLRLRSLWAFSLPASFLISRSLLLLRCKTNPRSLPKNFVLIAFFLWLRLVHFAKIFIVLLKPLLKASQAHSQARLVDFVIDHFVQDRKIWFQWFEVLNVSNPKLRWFLVKISSVNRAGAAKGLVSSINWRLLRLTRSAGRSWAHGIWNNSRFANGRFSKFELPSFQNGFQFNCHFGLRLDFGLDTLHYPLQHRPRFWLEFFMYVFNAPAFPQRL